MKSNWVVMNSPAIFLAPRDIGIAERFTGFINWARPFGTAGINSIHAPFFNEDTPFFEWAPAMLAHGDNTTRSWLLKQDYLSAGRSVFGRVRKGSEPKILNSDGLISPGQFLRFSKAYINVMSFYRELRSPPKPLVIALSFVEKTLRDLNEGSNDPTKLSGVTFERSIRLLEESNYCASKKFDIGKEIEILAAMLQSGHHSKKFRFSGMGFRLLEKPFTFRSPIPSPPRRRAINQNSEDLTTEPAGRLSSEEVAAVGLAYSKSAATYGKHDQRTFIAAITGLGLTTVSMRVSDILTLGRTAIYKGDFSKERYRIRLGRPKIDVHQDLPIPTKLGPLADELFQVVLGHSQEAHKAMDFYVRRFGDNFDAIDDLYVPPDLDAFFSKPYLNVEDVHSALRIQEPTSGAKQFPARLRELEVLHFIDVPGDVWSPSAIYYKPDEKYVTIREVEAAALKAGFHTNFPVTLNRGNYITAQTALKHMSGGALLKQAYVRALVKGGRTALKVIRTSDLRAYLLADFKKQVLFPHWPYTGKEKYIKVNEALLVSHLADCNRHQGSAENKGLWWRPGLVTAGFLNRWINTGRDRSPPILFKTLNVRLKNGEFPALTLQATRRYHHTAALLAGAQEVFIDELAGRKSGRQSDHYDLRTPHEILAQSIDTFDPDAEFEVIGPVAEQAGKVKLADKKAFLYENAAPKHLTEIGGCSTDWSLDPCKQYGDCTRCDQQLWRKGDQARLVQIQKRRAYAIEMINVAEQKIGTYDEVPRSLRLQHQQFKDDLARCDTILAIEEDETIRAGTIVTFAQAPDSMTVSQRTLLLRQQNNDSSAKG